MESKDIIKAILDREGLTAAALAKKVGLHPTQIYDLQRGKVKRISAGVANKVITIFPHYSLQWLTTGEGDMLVTPGMNAVFGLMGTPEQQPTTKKILDHLMPPADLGNLLPTTQDPKDILIDEYKRRLQKLEQREQQLIDQLRQKDDQITRLLTLLARSESGYGKVAEDV